MASVYDFQNQGKELENLLRLKGYGLPKPAPTSTAIPSAAAVAENLMTPETAATPFVPQIQRKKSVTDTTKKGLLKQFDTGSAVTEGLQTDTKEQSVTPTYGDPAETMRLLKEYQGAPEAVGLRENAENLRGMAQELAGRSPSGFAGLDLSPLIAYADAKSGMNLLKGYNAPKGGRMYDTISLMKEADKVESQAAGLPLQYLKATQGQKISGITGKESLTTKDTTNEKMSQTLNEIKTKLDSEGTGGNNTAKLAERLNFADDRWIKKDIAPQIDGITTMLRTSRRPGNPTEAGRLRYAFARSAQGVGVVTDSDLRIGAAGDSSLESLVDSIIAKRAKGEGLSDQEALGFYQASTRVAQQKLGMLKTQIEAAARYRAEQTGEKEDYLLDSYYKRSGRTREDLEKEMKGLPAEEAKATAMYERIHPDAGRQRTLITGAPAPKRTLKEIDADIAAIKARQEERAKGTVK